MGVVFNYNKKIRLAVATALLSSTQLLAAQGLNISIPVSINLPAQYLADSLKQFAQQTGTNIVFDSTLVQGKLAPAVKGNFDNHQTLHKLLAGSGLEAVIEEKTIVIKRERIKPTKAVDINLEEVVVRAKRLYEIGPLRGLALTKEEIPGNVQSITAKEIKESRAISISDLMNSKLQSVNVNDYQSNPFQMDVS